MTFSLNIMMPIPLIHATSLGLQESFSFSMQNPNDDYRIKYIFYEIHNNLFLILNKKKNLQIEWIKLNLD